MVLSLAILLCNLQPSASDRQLTIWIIATLVWFVILRLLKQQHVDPLACVAWSWTCMHGLDGHSLYAGSHALCCGDCVWFTSYVACMRLKCAFLYWFHVCIYSRTSDCAASICMLNTSVYAVIPRKALLRALGLDPQVFHVMGSTPTFQHWQIDSMQLPHKVPMWRTHSCHMHVGRPVSITACIIMHMRTDVSICGCEDTSASHINTLIHTHTHTHTHEKFLTEEQATGPWTHQQAVSWFCCCPVPCTDIGRVRAVPVAAARSASHSCTVLHILRLLKQQHVDPLVCVAWSWTCMHGLERHSVYVGSHALCCAQHKRVCCHSKESLCIT
jgi:hypothetical protein